jgi:hypothetical protein
MNGTSQQCKETTVSKSTFENYTCDRDVATIQTCGRTASITGHYEDNYSYKTITMIQTIWTSAARKCPTACRKERCIQRR